MLCVPEGASASVGDVLVATTAMVAFAEAAKLGAEELRPVVGTV